MNIAFCYESVLPARGGCETYIADLARRLLADRHQVHVYASRWDEQALPAGIQYHAIGTPPPLSKGGLGGYRRCNSTQFIVRPR